MNQTVAEKMKPNDAAARYGSSGNIEIYTTLLLRAISMGGMSQDDHDE